MPNPSPQKALQEMFERHYATDLAADFEHVVIPQAIQALSQRNEKAAKLVSELIPDYQEKIEFLIANNYLIDPRVPLKADSPVIMHLRRMVALGTENNELDRPIRAAFKKAGLEESNPINWHILLGLFARAHFGPKRGRGPPTQWTSARYCQLLYDAHPVEMRNPTFSATSICDRLKKDRAYDRRYHSLSLETLRRELRKAARPKYNKILGATLEIEISRLKDLHQKSGREWTAQVGRTYEERVRNAILKFVREHWPDYLAGKVELVRIWI